MTNFNILMNNLLEEVKKLREKYELSLTVEPDYYEPGFMEYLDQYDGKYDKETETIYIKTEAMGTRYEGRTEQIESVKLGDKINIIRDAENAFNRNNFLLLTESNKNVGTLSADLCNVIAPLYDNGHLSFKNASVSFVEPISKRSRHAKKAILFVEFIIEIKNPI